MVCVNCGRREPATRSARGNLLEDPTWYVNAAGDVACGLQCADDLDEENELEVPTVPRWKPKEAS